MIPKLKQSWIANLAISRKKYGLSHTISALFVWITALIVTGGNIASTITNSLNNSFKYFDGANHPTDLFMIRGAGDTAVIRIINSLLNSLSVLFIPLLPRNKAGVPIAPPQFKSYSEGELTYVTPDPKTMFIWFGTAILMIIFLFLVMDYVYEFLGVLFIYSASNSPTLKGLAVCMGIGLIVLWLIALSARLRDGGSINPAWAFFVVGFVIYFLVVSSLPQGSNLVLTILTVVGLLWSSYIGFCAMFHASDYNKAFTRDAQRKDKRYIKGVMKGKW